MKISEALQQPDGMPVTDLLARVAKVWGEKTGTSTHGPWRVINFQLKDDTGEIRTAWWNPPESVTLKNLNGQLLKINAVKAAKGGGLVGANREDRTHDGKTYQNIKLSGNGAVLYDGGGAGAASSPQSSPQSPPGGVPGRLTLEQAYRIQEAMVPRFAHLFSDEQATAACVNTLLIAVTRGDLHFDPLSLDQGDAPEGPEPEDDDAYRYGDPIEDDGEVPF